MRKCWGMGNFSALRFPWKGRKTGRQGDTGDLPMIFAIVVAVDISLGKDGARGRLADRGDLQMILVIAIVIAVAFVFLCIQYSLNKTFESDYDSDCDLKGDPLKHTFQNLRTH